MVVIGNEILSGKIVDSNSPFLARELRELGVQLSRIVVVPDEIPVVAAAVRDCSRSFDWVFTSGGVGPTHDDITIEAVAAAFSVPVVEDAELRQSILSMAHDKPSEHLLKMARIPSGAELIHGEDRIFPALRIENVHILPGIPQLFEAKLVEMRERFRSSPYHLREILVARAETTIAGYLDATLAAFPELMLGSYPSMSKAEYRVRLTLESKDEAYVDGALEDLVSRMPEGYVVKIES